VIDFHNAVLYPKDLEYFQDSNWLNDNCMNFVFHWYQHSLHSSAANSTASAFQSSQLAINPLLFLDPSVISHIRCQVLDADDIRDLHRGLKLSSRSHLFIPCNDQSSFTSSSTHWSLLLIDLIDRQVYSLDSMSPSNSHTMGVIAKIICQDLLSWSSLPSLQPLMLFPFLHRDTVPSTISVQCPQQTNSYDCGIYVLLYALHIAQLLSPLQQQPQALTPHLIQQSVSSIAPQDCYAYRRQILTVILPAAMEQVQKARRVSGVA
jgi:hypothetical protein